MTQTQSTDLPDGWEVSASGKSVVFIALGRTASITPNKKGAAYNAGIAPCPGIPRWTPLGAFDTQARAIAAAEDWFADYADQIIDDAEALKARLAG